MARCKPTANRPIERQYLATLHVAVPLEAWQVICKRAADDALAGDAKARDWLAKCRPNHGMVTYAVCAGHNL